MDYLLKDVCAKVKGTLKTFRGARGSMDDPHSGAKSPKMEITKENPAGTGLVDCPAGVWGTSSRSL